MLMMLKEIIAVYSENYEESINTLHEQNKEFRILKQWYIQSDSKLLSRIPFINHINPDDSLESLCILVN